MNREINTPSIALPGARLFAELTVDPLWRSLRKGVVPPTFTSILAGGARRHRPLVATARSAQQSAGRRGAEQCGSTCHWDEESPRPNSASTKRCDLGSVVGQMRPLPLTTRRAGGPGLRARSPLGYNYESSGAKADPGGNVDGSNVSRTSLLVSRQRVNGPFGGASLALRLVSKRCYRPPSPVGHVATPASL
jgi:hypothetical protein